VRDVRGEKWAAEVAGGGRETANAGGGAVPGALSLAYE